MKPSESNKKTWDVKQRQAGAVVVLEVSGHLEMGGGSDRLEEELQKLVREGRAAVVLECSQVHSIDSSAVGALVRCFISLDKQGGQLKLLKMSPTVRAAIQFVGLANRIETFEDEAAALASFK